nr:MAG TPA: hypothetical protein [Caudoviricetes sp.]
MSWDSSPRESRAAASRSSGLSGSARLAARTNSASSGRSSSSPRTGTSLL